MADLQRIRRMEACFDRLRETTDQEALRTLKEYYENGQWLEDYERDERGEFPPDLKRGVLSQDGLYDLLGEITSSEA